MEVPGLGKLDRTVWLRYGSRMDGIWQKVTVNLTPKASEALSQAAQLSEHNRTDTINRALQLYAFVLAELAAGRRIAVIDHDDTVREIHLL